MVRAIRLEHQYRSQENIMLISWNLGNVCNYSCSYCPPSLHSGSMRWPPLGVVIAFAEHMIAHSSSSGLRPYFQFVGGEPTLFPWMTTLASFLKDGKCGVGLISNGSRPSKWWSKIAPFLDYVCLTYHAEHAKWPAFIDTLNVLVGRMQVHVNITMIPERFDQCRESANRIAGLFGSVSVTMKPLLKDFGTQLYDYSAEQLAVLRDGLKGLKRTPSRLRVLPNRGPMRERMSDGSSHTISASQLLIRGENHWKGWMCYAGVEMLAITPDGRIFRAHCKQGGVIGSIYDQNIAFPVLPILCQKESCACLADIMTTKDRSPAVPLRQYKT
jgi:hypothetical protein